MDTDNYDDYDASTPSTSQREPEWVTFATPICIGVAILLCFAKIMCRNCTAEGRRRDSVDAESGQQQPWFVRSQQQFAQNSGIPPMIDAFFPAPPKYEDVMRAKEEEDGGRTPPGYVASSPPRSSSLQSSRLSTVLSEASLSEHDAPPDYSTMARPATTRRCTVATTSIDDEEPRMQQQPVTVVVHAAPAAGRDNRAFASDASDAPSSSSSSRPVSLSVEQLQDDSQWETARC